MSRTRVIATSGANFRAIAQRGSRPPITPSSPCIESGDLRLDFLEIAEALPARFYRKAPGVEQVENLPVGPRLQLTLDRLDREREEAEPPPPRERRIELAKAAGSRVPGVCEEWLALTFALLIHPLEAGIGHVDLAADFHEAGPSSSLERERDVGDRAEIGGDVFSDDAIASGRADGESPVLVGEAHGRAVDFDLGGISRAADLGDYARVPIFPLGQLVGRECVGKGEHRATVGMLGKGSGDRGAHPLGGAIR
jgi:hypothetical protein